MENRSNIKINIPTEKNFSKVCFIFFVICSFFIFENYKFLSILLFLFALFILISGFYLPKLLKIPNRIWFYFGIYLGRFVSPVIMGVIYFLILFPTSILSKLIGKNSINTKFDVSTKSYWINRETPIQPFKDQF